MLITTKDGAGQEVQADVDDNRVAELNDFFRRNPSVFGFGNWSRFNKAARDAAEAQAFAVSQLAYVEQKVFERQYQPLLFEELLGGTIDYSAGEWAQTVEYQVVDYVGMGKRVSPAGNDIPFVDVAMARVAKPVAQGAIGYKYNTEDIRVSGYLGRPLPVAKLNAANMGYRRHINKVALVGEAQSNFTGLFNNAGVTAANRPSAAAWTAATPDTIYADLLAGISAVEVATSNNDSPTRVVMPLSVKQYLLKARATQSDTILMKFLKENFPGVTFSFAKELETLGAGVTKRVVFYNPNNENAILHLPMQLRFLAPQLKQLDTEVPGEYKYGGLEIRRTPTAYYMDGV